MNTAPILASTEVKTRSQARSRLDERTRSVRIKKQSLKLSNFTPNQGEHHAY